MICLRLFFVILRVDVCIFQTNEIMKSFALE